MSAIGNTVWSDGAIPLSEWKFRGLRQIVLPILYSLLVLAGPAAIGGGVPAIDEFFPRAISIAGGTLLSAAALASFVGLAWPRLWLLEAGSLVVVVMLLGGYVTSLIVLVLTVSIARGFAGCIAGGFLVIVVFRVLWIATDRAEVRTAANQALREEQ